MIRQYNTEIGTLTDKIVKVYISEEKFFVGQLKGMSETNDLLLVNAKNEKGKLFPTLLVKNTYYNYISVEEEPFPMKSLADRISVIFKGHVNYVEDQNVISVLGGKILVDENGVRGEGPSADKVKKIYDQFKIDRKSPPKELE